MGRRSVGVEEEFLLVDPDDGTVRALAGAALDSGPAREADGPGEEIESELHLQQVETGSAPAVELSELRLAIRRARSVADESARAVGARLAALGTSPLPAHPVFGSTPRYQRIRERFGALAEEQLTCGCHVHVGVSSDEEGVAVLDRLRPWLAPLLALSANSPFWQGSDSGHASYRSRVWSRWPSAGPTEPFGTPAAYHDTVRALTGTDALVDAGMVYFDARLSRRYPTVEVRVADVCLYADDAVLLASLTRALVQTAAAAWRAERPPAVARVELLRAAAWHAGRYGLDGDLLDPSDWRPRPAREVVRGLLEHVRDALEDAGDLAITRELCDAVLDRGTGARRQRAVHADGETLNQVVSDAVCQTVSG
jgi:carboxylate-amine ligase